MIRFEDITAEWIDQEGKRNHEPRWLRQQRVKAWEQFSAHPAINWKKSKTPELNFAESIALEAGMEAQEIKVEKKPPAECAAKLTFFDGKGERLSLKPELAYEGVIFLDLKTAIIERADLIEQYFAQRSQQDDPFALLQQALWQNGAFLSIPRGLRVEEPFQIQQLHRSAKNIFQQNIILLEEESSVIIEDLSSSEQQKQDQALCASSTFIVAEQSAHLRYFRNQNWSSSVYTLEDTQLLAKRDAKLVCLFAQLGSGQGRVKIHGDASAPGARIQHDAIIIGKDKQRLKVIAEMNHEAEHTEGLMRYKGILKDNAYCDLAGLIRVQPNAQQAASRLEEQTLLLSDDARCDALPALDIKTDDVQVSHAAAVSQADAEKMFYLMSRGLSEDQARALLVEGFFENLLSLIPRQAWYEETKSLIESKLLQTA